MILVFLCFFKTSFGSEVIFTEEDIFYHLENRIHIEENSDNSSLMFSIRSGFLAPVDTIYLSIDRAVVSLNNGGYEFYLGRESLFWGYGMFYSPFFYARSSMSPFDEELLKSGKNIFNVRYNNISYMTPEFIVFLPDGTPEIDSVKAGIRLNFFSWGIESHFPLVFSKDAVYTGAGVRFSLLGFTVFSDHSLDYYSEDFTLSSTVGFNKIIGSDFYLQSEYFYNQRGLSTDEYDALDGDSIIEFLNWGYTGRHYIYSLCQWSKYEIIGLGIFSLINPQWKSGLLGVTLSSAYFDNTHIALNYIRILKGREFDLVPYDNSVLLEFRYYL
jgi:hypothetical protein